VEFIETSIFTERIDRLLSTDEYRHLQELLASSPKRGDVIPGAVGLRKLRWGSKSRGKRGGIRVIYCCADNDRIYMIFAYDKARQNDLTAAQLRVLSEYVKGGVL
jgi:mRNA-degrading endonuclease RelE of RelBE toxin-antitoxin system